MTRTMLLVVVLIFPACVSTPSRPQPYNLVMAQNDCAAQGAPFALLSGCLQSQMQQHAPEWVIGRDADLLGVYFSWLSAAGNRVAVGQMAEEDARRQSSELLIRLRAIDSQRQATVQAAARQRAITNALTGFALMNQPPQAGPPSPTIYVINGRQIVCSQMSNVVTCN